MTLLSRLRSRPLARVLFLTTAIAAAVALASCGGPAQPTPTLNATASRGEVVFAKYCNSCHPKGGRGSGPSLVQTGISKDEFTRYVRNGKGRMPGFNEGVIPNEDLDEMYEYISGLSK